MNAKMKAGKAKRLLKVPGSVVITPQTLHGVDEEASLKQRRTAGLKKGGTKGAKHRSTKLKEALDKRTSEIADGVATAPLEVLLDIMLRRYNRFLHLSAVLAAPPVIQVAPADADPIEFAERVRDARIDLMGETQSTERAAADYAIAAAPYCHSKLQTIDKNVKRNVAISIISFKDAPDVKEPE